MFKVALLSVVIVLFCAGLATLSCKLKRVIFYEDDMSRVAPRAVQGAELSAATRAPTESFLWKVSTITTFLTI